MLILLAVTSFRTWAKEFQLKMTEDFYRINFTYYVYIAFIKVVMALLIGFPDTSNEEWKSELIIQSRYIIECTLAIFVLLPFINKYIYQEKTKSKI